MADKTVIISVEDLQLTFKRVTEASISEELDAEIIKTFDEPVSVPSSDGGYTVDISALEARTVDDFKTLKKILNKLKTQTGNLTINELVHVRGEPDFLAENYLSGVRLTSNEVKFDAEDLTARDLSFAAEALREVVDGEEIE